MATATKKTTSKTTPVTQLSSAASTVATPKLTPVTVNKSTPVVAAKPATNTVNRTTTSVAPKTNLQDVINTFVRYYGRQPNSEDIVNLNYLTTKAPAEVEASLKSTSASSKAKGNTGTASAGDPNQAIYDDIDKMSSISPEQKLVLKQIAKGSYTSNSKVLTPQDLESIIKDATTNAETDINPYFEKTTSQDLEDLKNGLADIRNEAARYAQQDAKTYKEKLDTERAKMRANGLTFSGVNRKVLGKEGANDWAGVEGEVPQERRYNWEDKGALWNQKDRNLGLAAERAYGSKAIESITSEGKILMPYDYKNGGIDYTAGRTGDQFLVKQIDPTTGLPQEGYIRSRGQGAVGNAYMATSELDRQKAIEQAKWDRISKYKLNV